MPDVTPLLWFEGDAEEAARFYVSIFKNSMVTSVSEMMVEFSLDGHDVMALNAPTPEPTTRNTDFQQGKIALFI
ncbi:MAG: VOC family protein, partial [Candidatus Aquilonibacter sp.]